MHLSLAPALLQAVYDDTSTVYLKVRYLVRVSRHQPPDSLLFWVGSTWLGHWVEMDILTRDALRQSGCVDILMA